MPLAKGLAFSRQGIFQDQLVERQPSLSLARSYIRFALFLLS